MFTTDEEINTFAAQSAQKLWDEGIVIFNFADVFGADAWDKMCLAYEDFTLSDHYLNQRDAFLSDPPSIDIDNLEKRFLFRLIPPLHSSKVYEYPEGDPWMEIAKHPILIRSAREYFAGGDPCLSYHDLWYTMPQSEIEGDDRPRVASQKWHVDAEAEGVPRRIFKAFLYFNDIDAESGPLEIYISGASMNPEKHIQVCVPRGSMIFVDTGRFLHRGGYCLTKPRMLSLWYYSNASGLRIPPLVSTPRFKAQSDIMQAIGREPVQRVFG